MILEECYFKFFFCSANQGEYKLKTFFSDAYQHFIYRAIIALKHFKLKILVGLDTIPLRLIF
jgi:hypothetical protein